VVRGKREARAGGRVTGLGCCCCCVDDMSWHGLRVAVVVPLHDEDCCDKLSR
jgi:hypothetical protein